jgi:hypothetical protein
MPYADEDEIDWSDGPLDPLTPDFIEPTAVSSYLNTTAGHYDDQDSLFVSDTEGLYSIPCGLPLDPGKILATNEDVALTLHSFLERQRRSQSSTARPYRCSDQPPCTIKG